MRTTRVRLFSILLVMLAATCFFTSQASAWPVPDTGQTKCYNASGTEITCPQPGQALYGQDANYTINPPSYTKLGQDGVELPDDATTWIMVRDNVTGLIWEVKTTSNRGTTYTWSNAFSYVNSLNAASFGGFSDWRLPTRKELRSIVNYGRYNPSIDTAYFPNTQASDYWSSTTRASTTDTAWSMRFNYGGDYDHAKSLSSIMFGRCGPDSDREFGHLIIW